MFKVREYVDDRGRSPYARWFDRIDFGPGYRIYFGKDSDTPIVLLGGGTKVRQQRDIEAAGNLWREYRRRKREEG